MEKATIVFVYILRFKDYPILYEYCSVLHARGNNVYYIGISDKNEEYNDSSGVKVFHADKSKLKSKLDFAKYSANLINEIRPNIIHVFHFRWCVLLPLVTGFGFKFLLDVRTVHIANNKGSHSIFSPLKNRLTWMESLLFNRSIALTSRVKKMLSPSIWEIPVIPLGANVEKFKPLEQNARNKLREEFGFDNSTILLLYSGTLCPTRKIETLIDSFYNLAKNLRDVHLLMVGSNRNNPNVLKELRAKVLNSEFFDRITFTGFLQYDQMIKYYQIADIGLSWMPQVSFHDKQPPTKLFEYMAAGLLVVGTNTSAIKEIIEDRVNGFIADDNAESFSECLRSAVTYYRNDPSKMINAGNKTIESFSWDYIIGTYLKEFYSELGIKWGDAKLLGV